VNSKVCSLRREEKGIRGSSDDRMGSFPSSKVIKDSLYLCQSKIFSSGCETDYDDDDRNYFYERYARV